jgi:hypothetical protein
VYQQQQQQEQQQQQQQEQDAENPFLDPPFSRIKILLASGGNTVYCIAMISSRAHCWHCRRQRRQKQGIWRPPPQPTNTVKNLRLRATIATADRSMSCSSQVG